MPSTAETEADERLLHCRILTFLEAAFESLPQAALQSGVLLLYPGSLQPNLYLFSVVCSLGVTAVALITFAQHRHRVRIVLRPKGRATPEQGQQLKLRVHHSVALPRKAGLLRHYLRPQPVD